MSDVILKFSDLWQEAVVGHMFLNYPFFLNCRTHINHAWFRDAFAREVVKVMFDTYDNLATKRQIKAGEIDGKFAQLHPDINTYHSYRSCIMRCGQSAKHVGLDILASDMTTWIRIGKLQEALIKGESLFNKQQYDRCSQEIGAAMRDIMSTDFSPMVEASFHDPITFFEQRNEDLKSCMTIGHPEFDAQLRPGSKIHNTRAMTAQDLSDISNLTHGSLVPGDSTVLVGPTNAGKTTVCITIVGWNVRMGKDVLYITFEQKERDIMTNLYKSYALKSGVDLSQLENNQTNALEVSQAAYQFTQRLSYVSYTDPTKMYIEDVLALIETLQERRKSTTGKGYDLMIVDYPGKLHSRLYANKKVSGWEEKTYVHEQMYMMARHHNIHGVFPVQTNREGFRVNKGDANRFLDTDDVAQAFNLTHGADNIITINRSAKQEALGMIQFYVSKARLGRKAWAFISKTDFDHARTHGLGLMFRIDLTGDKGQADAAVDTIIKAGGKVDVMPDIDKMVKNIEIKPEDLSLDNPGESEQYFDTYAKTEDTSDDDRGSGIIS